MGHYQADYVQLKSDYEKLQRNLNSQAAATNGDDAAQLRFHLEAYKTKLRKYAAHCQKLEDERTSIMHTMRSTNIEGVNQLDLSSSIVLLCDKVVSLEERCGLLQKSDTVSNSDELKKQNEIYASQLAGYKRQIDEFTEAEAKLIEQVSFLKNELEVNRQLLAETTSHTEMTETIRHLERENLQLMSDLRRANDEIKLARAQKYTSLQDAEDTTLEIDALKSRLALTAGSRKDRFNLKELVSTPSGKSTNESLNKTLLSGAKRSSSKIGFGNISSATLEKENSTNALSSRKLPKKQKIAKLGESSCSIDDLDQPECTQS